MVAEGAGVGGRGARERVGGDEERIRMMMMSFYI